MRDDDEAGSDGFCFASDRRLMDSSPLMNVLWGLPRGTTEYLRSVPRKAIYNFIFGFNSFAIDFISESNLSDETTKALDYFPLKALFLRDEIQEKTLERLKTWGNRPIILTEGTNLAARLRRLFDSPVLAIEEVTLGRFEMDICNVVDRLMEDTSYVQSLPWSSKHIEILKSLPNLIRNKQESIFPTWPLRKNRIIAPIDLIINRNRGHIDFQETDIESDEKLWIKEVVSTVYRCFAEMSLMEALAYFENNELTERNLKALEIDKEILDDIIKGNQEKFNEVVNKFIRRFDLLQRNHGIMLWCPCINPYLQIKTYAAIDEMLKKFFDKRIPERIMKAFLKDTGYKFQFSPEELLRDDKDLTAFFSFMLGEYARENALLSNITTFFSLRNNRPKIKTPKLSSSFFGRMRQLQNLILQDEISPETVKKFGTLWKEFRKDLTHSIPAKIRDLLYHLPKIPLQFISDLPLEWVEIGGTPLMFERELSRLPVTSANGLMRHYTVTEEPFYISTLNKPDVLLIDAVGEKDPVKSLTKSTLGLLTEEAFSSVFNISMNEVRGVADLFSIIQEKKPFICLIDTHATYDRENDIGYLQIGSDKWNPWAEKLPYAPPIMILNSCQTSVVDGTFNTAANGLLAAGVRSIIGTLFPISAEIGSHMCVRLFSNLSAALTGEDKLLTWRKVISKTIMLNHYLDYVLQFKDYLIKKNPHALSKLSDRFALDYTSKWNTNLKREKTMFFKKPFEDNVFETVSEIMKDYGLTEEFKNFIASCGILPETCFFVSLGTPESIFTFDPERAKHHFSMFDDY